MFLSAGQDAIPCEALEYVIGQVNYGGRCAFPFFGQLLWPCTCCCCVGGAGLGCMHVARARCNLRQAAWCMPVWVCLLRDCGVLCVCCCAAAV
jgi:hypothetical protein